MGTEAAWQQFIDETPEGVGGDGEQLVQLPLELGLPHWDPLRIIPMIQLDFIDPFTTMGLYVPSSLPERERLLAGLARCEWVWLIDGLHHFPIDYLQKMIFLIQNYPLRWGIIGE